MLMGATKKNSNLTIFEYPPPFLLSDMDYWLALGRTELDRALAATQVENEGVAKNVILFLGSGMSISTVTAARGAIHQLLNIIL
jgi:alkaline phosphatase